MSAGFLPDCYFLRSVARRPIFLTLNKVVKSPYVLCKVLIDIPVSFYGQIWVTKMQFGTVVVCNTIKFFELGVPAYISLYGIE